MSDSASVDALLKSLENLEDVVKSIIDGPQTFSSRLEALPDQERAQLLSSLAYSLVSLSWVSLRSSGASLAEHPIKKEIDRVRAYMTKTAKLSDPIEAEDKPSMRVDKEAADRIVRQAANSKRKLI